MNTIAVIGDFNPSNRSHLATDYAIRRCAESLGLAVEHLWIGTDEILGPEAANRLLEFNGLWIGPGSPYRNMEGALLAIRTAREQRIPLIGTCGGFQHIIIEFARDVLGIPDAEHEETSPHAPRLFISKLACSLVGRSMTITLEPDSLVARMYRRTATQEEYLCNFGVNPEFEEALRSSALRIVGADEEAAVRAVELAEHPFFVGTLFIPQLSSTPESPHPLVSAFIKHAAGPSGDTSRYRSMAELEAGFKALPDPPKEVGRLSLIVRRRADGTRETPDRVRLTLEDGLTGDGWRQRPPRSREAQVSVVRQNVAELIANGQPLSLFGDNLFTDLDLSAANLPVGTRIRVGEALVEMTAKPHNGCGKFARRFGDDALRFVQAKPTRDQNLRGVFWKVVEPGEIRIGAPVRVVSRA